ncbi:putative HCaRG protein [Tanacetum coccineum]
MSQIDGMDSTNAKCCRALLVFDKWRCDDLASRPSQAAIEEKTTIIHVIPTKLLVCLRMLIRKCVCENANKDDIQKLIPAEVSPEIQRLLTLLQKFHGEWREDILKDQVPSKDLKTKPSLNDEILSRPTSMDNEMLPRLTDTSSAQARTAKDIQEISWERFPLSVDTVDKV